MRPRRVQYMGAASNGSVAAINSMIGLNRALGEAQC
jgi:hypothetical protein